MNPAPAEVPGQPPAAPARERRLVALALGVLLLAAAIWALVSQGQALDRAWAEITTRASTGGWGASGLLCPLALLIVLPIGNWLATAGQFWAVMGRYAPVGYREMLCLIGGSWLMNYLPLKPGLLGRLAYHRAINGVPLSTGVWAWALGLAAGVMGVVTVTGAGAAASAMGWLGPSLVDTTAGGAGPGAGRPEAVALAGLLGACAAVMAVGAIIAARVEARRGMGSASALLWRLVAAAGFKWLDVACAAGRAWAALSLVGYPVDIGTALLVAIVSQAVGLLPVPLGVREWAVGLTVSALPVLVSGWSGGVLERAGPGLAAELVSRAGELLVAIPAGVMGIRYVTRRVMGQGRAANTPRKI